MYNLIHKCMHDNPGDCLSQLSDVAETLTYLFMDTRDQPEISVRAAQGLTTILGAISDGVREASEQVLQMQLELTALKNATRPVAPHPAPSSEDFPQWLKQEPELEPGSGPASAPASEITGAPPPEGKLDLNTAEGWNEMCRRRNAPPKP